MTRPPTGEGIAGQRIEVGDTVTQANQETFHTGQVTARVTEKTPSRVWMDTGTWAFLEELLIHQKWYNRPRSCPHSKPSKATPKANSAADLLENAAVLIGTRGKQRDDGDSQERSMTRTVETFNAMTGHQLTESDGWLFMRYLKDARARKGEFNRDDYDDGIAYAALQAEAAINENEEDT